MQSTGSAIKWNLDYRYGIKTDVGFDITDKFAVFGNFALVNNSYDAMSSSGHKTGNSFAESIGDGVKYSLKDDLDINLSYETSEVKMSVAGVSDTRFDVNVIRLGAAYNF